MSGEKRPRRAQDGPAGQEDRAPAGGRQRSVFVYLAILFAAAFLMLLLAYFMQQRSSEEIMGNLSDLQESMGSIRSIDQLTEENRTLREENQALREENQALKDAGEDMKKSLDDLTGQVTELDAARRTQNLDLEEMAGQLEERENALRAMDLLWQLDKAYITEDYDLCRELIARLRDHEGTDLTSFLPDDPNAPERSAARRYREIAADVAGLGSEP